MNIGIACTRRQCELGRGEHTAMFWVSPGMQTTRLSFTELDTASNRFANALERLGVKAGQVCAVYMPRAPEVFVAMLGALKRRVVVCPLFANLGDGALLERLNDSGARVLVTRRDLLGRLSAVRARAPRLEHVVVVDAEDDPRLGTLSWNTLMESSAPTAPAVDTDAAAPSVLHFTSGSTGRPKGVLHVHGALPYQERTGREVLDLAPGDVYWCTADQAWVTGTTYGVIAPWALGVAQVQFGGAYDAEKWCRVLEEQAVTVWYTAPTALRMLMREPVELFRRFDFRRLRHICSVGEPLNPEVSVWAAATFGRPVHDTWFQTETGAIMISNRPGLPMRPGSMGKPLDGIETMILRDDGSPAAVGELGSLCLRAGWPSMFVGYLGAEEEYRRRFVNGYYVTGDTAYVDADGYHWFQGRSDDVINTAGHLVSPFEVESALLELPEVAESGVVAAPDPVLAEKVVAFVCLRPPHTPSRPLELKLRAHVARRVSPIAAPMAVYFVDDLPKNASGKILRRVLRTRLIGESQEQQS